MIGRAGLCGDRSDDDVRAQGFQIARLFDRGFVGHHKNALVTFYGRGDRQADAGIARSGFDDRPAGFQFTFALCRINHRDADAILHGETRIEILHLGENQGLQPFVDAIDFD